MSTNFSVAYLDPKTDKILSIYGHWDGYYGGAGKTLVEHYNTLEKVKKLVAMGSVSILDKKIGKKCENFEHVDGSCLFYHRDRDENLEIAVFDDYDDVIEHYGPYCYNYFFIDDRWVCEDGELAEIVNDELAKRRWKL